MKALNYVIPPSVKWSWFKWSWFALSRCSWSPHISLLSRSFVRFHELFEFIKVKSAILVLIELLENGIDLCVSHLARGLSQLRLGEISVSIPNRRRRDMNEWIMVNYEWLITRLEYIQGGTLYLSYALKASRAFSCKSDDDAIVDIPDAELDGLLPRLYRDRIFISTNSSRLMPPSPSLSLRAIVRSIHSRSDWG